MDYLNTVLVYLGRAWTAVWTKLKALGDREYDIKPKTYRFLFFTTFAVFMGSAVFGIVVWSMGTSWVNRRLADMVGLGSSVQSLISGPVDASKPDPMPGLRLSNPLPKPLPVPPVSVSEGNHAKAEPVAAPKAEKIRRKKKQKKEAAASDPWNF